MQIRGLVLLALISCIGTALAVAVSGRGESDSSPVVGATEKHAYRDHSSTIAQEMSSQDNIHFDLAAIKRTVPEEPRPGNLFNAKSWYVPPPPPPPVQLADSIDAVPAQSAPALPFTYIGKMLDGTEVILFLSGKGNNYSAKLNDVLDATYRIDQIGDSKAVLTYLPMNVQQTLEFNSSIGERSDSGSPVVEPLAPSAITRSGLP